MKSLNDYRKILRETASNLNLHGESVEMIVQMLANYLYISEVEHIAYSQEASLERASLENSKIQHCVNQMYSVYRGANPRIIINIRASKLFQFNPHEEIIKSNNFKVYYIGYYDEDSKEIIYSSCTVYPDSSKTIVGLISSDVLNESWTVSDNLYYRDFPISDLSSDLYITDVSTGETVDMTRIFNDHLRQNKFFDLTLPGYGCRIYYPEVYQGTQRKNYTNFSFELSVYPYFKLDTIQESEKKALKMGGSVIESFPESTLLGLGAKETYPGIIYIPETLRDGIDTLHHRANKNRFVGTFLSTNSDLSYLLGEYYPEKIRRGGITYKFIAPESSRVERMSGYYDLESSLSSVHPDTKTVFLEPTRLGLGTTESPWIDSGLGFLPEGKVTLNYKKSIESSNKLGSNVSYDIVPSTSIITAQISGTIINLTTDQVKFTVLKNYKGDTSVISSYTELYEEGLALAVYLPSRGTFVAPSSGNDMRFRFDNTQRWAPEDTELYVYLVPTYSLDASGQLPPTFNPRSSVDSETIPVVYTPVNYVVTDSGERLISEEEGHGNYFVLNLKDDNLYVRSDYAGNMLSGNTTKATMYHNGQRIEDGRCKYSYQPVSGVELEVNEMTGDIRVISLPSTGTTFRVTIVADYTESYNTVTLTIKKSNANVLPSRVEVLNIYGDSTKIASFVASEDMKTSEIEIPKNKYKELSIEKGSLDVSFDKSGYEYSYDILNNVISSNSILTPSLHLYYIPYAESNLLSRNEKDRFILENKSYYVTQDIEIIEGKSYIAEFNINLDLYKSASLDDSILEILERYSYRFNTDFGDKDHETDIQKEIKSLITKLSEIRCVNGISINYYTSLRERVNYEDIKDDLDISYFDVECNISSTIQN